MKQFTDNAGRSWAVEVNVAALKRTKGLAGVDLMGVLDGDLIEKFIRDPVLLCDAIYAVCKPEADDRGVSDEEFGRAMAGDAIEHATAALLDEIVSFCPNPRKRTALGKALKAQRTVLDKQMDVVDSKLDDEQIERMIRRAVNDTNEMLEAMMHGDSSTDAPASAESIPPP